MLRLEWSLPAWDNKVFDRLPPPLQPFRHSFAIAGWRDEKRGRGRPGDATNAVPERRYADHITASNPVAHRHDTCHMLPAPLGVAQKIGANDAARARRIVARVRSADKGSRTRLHAKLSSGASSRICLAFPRPSVGVRNFGRRRPAPARRARNCRPLTRRRRRSLRHSATGGLIGLSAHGSCGPVAAQSSVSAAKTGVNTYHSAACRGGDRR